MFNQPFYIPSYSATIPAFTRSFIPAAGGMAGAGARGAGLFSRLGGAFGAIRSINWGGFINNASKTLGVINQTIPLVRQVGPMVGNMRSMLKLASVFKDETDTPKANTKQYQTTNYSNNNITKNNYQPQRQSTSVNTNDSPTFFVQ